MGRYYVAGIPFDSENSLKHYGVKNMEWGKHKFGIDADDRYIKWLKNAGMNIGKFAANTAQNVAKGATTAAKTVGSAVNKGANFVGGTAQKAANQAGKWAGQQAQNAGKAIGTAAGNAGKWAGQQAQNAGKAIGTAAGNAGNWANEQIKNVGNFVTGDQARKDVQDARSHGGVEQIKNAQNAYNQTLPGMVENVRNGQFFDRVGDWGREAAGNVGNAVGQAARNVGNWAGQTAQNIGNFVTGDQARKDVQDARNNLQNAQNSFFIGRQGRVNNAQNAYDQAQNAYGQTLPGMVEDVANGKFFDRVGDWGREAAGNVGNAVGQAANQAREGIGGFFDRVGDWGREAAGNVGNWAGQTAQNIGNFVTGDQARKDVQDARSHGGVEQIKNAQNAYNQTLPGMVKSAGNAVSEIPNNAAEGAKGFINSAGKWVSGAANNVKNAASKAASDATKGASGFLNSAGKWVSNAANTAKNAVQNVGDYLGNKDDSRRAAEISDAHYDPFEKTWDNPESEKAFNEAVAAYNNSPQTKLRNAANTARDWAGQTAQNVGNAIGGAVDSVKQAPQNIANWYTGNDSRQKAQELTELGTLNQEYGNNLMNAARDGKWNSEKDQLDAYDEGMQKYLEGGSQLRSADRYGEMYYNAPRQRINSGLTDAGYAVSDAVGNVKNAVQNVGNAVGDWVGDRVDNVRDAITAPARQNEWDQLAARNQAIRDENERKFNELGGWNGTGIGAYNPNSGYMLENDLTKSWDQYHNNVRDINQNPVSSAVKYAAGNVGNWAGQAAQNVGQAVNQAREGVGGFFDRVGDWGRQAAGNVGNAVSGAAQNVGNWAGQAAQNVGNLVSEMANPRVQLNTQQMLDSYKQYLNDHPENPQSPKHTEWLKDQVRNDPELRAFYEQYMKHSAIDDKPEGVSDAFWAKFTADGGTREEYERDWR